MRRLCALAVLAALLLVPPNPLGAQAVADVQPTADSASSTRAPRLPVGTPVRFTLAGPAGREQGGRVADADSTRLVVVAGASRLAVPWSALRTLEVGDAQPRWVGALRWSVGCALLGAVVGVTVGRPNGPSRRSGAARDYLVAGAGAGLAVGWLLPSRRWHRVPLPSGSPRPSAEAH